MQRAITWRCSGKRSNGRTCTITEVSEYDASGHNHAPPVNAYVLVDHEPTERLGKGRYRILPRNEVVTCDHPDAP